MYSSVGTPVFYIDNFLYIKTIGQESEIWQGEVDSSWIENENVPNHTPTNSMDLFTLQPTIGKPLDYYNDVVSSGDEIFFTNVHCPILNMTDYILSDTMKGYVAILNNNMFYYQVALSGQGIKANQIEDWYTSCTFEQVTTYGMQINSWENTDVIFDQYIEGAAAMQGLGTNIFTFDTMPDADNIQLKFAANELQPYLGGISTGIQYTMPRTPELDLQMQIEYDGIDTITTSGGKSLTNIKYTGTPKWTNFNENGMVMTTPFSTFTSSSYNQVSQRNGRRKWSLSFKHLSNHDLFMSNPLNNEPFQTQDTSNMQSGDIYEDGSGNINFMHTVGSDDSFIAQVWNKTLGGGLPFIFQPDSTNKDEFYMCKFDQDTLSIKQSAFNVYDISVKITEVW